jgi:hypothetical protein
MEGDFLDTIINVFVMVLEGIIEAVGIKLPEGFDIAGLLGGLF